MGNQEHIDILKQGTEKWNRWRGEHADIFPDLRGADLSKMVLNNANLSIADLSESYLYFADLHEADISRAYLVGANLNWANLNRANLSGSYLSKAELSRARLVEAKLVGAELSYAIFNGSDLSGATLNESILRGAMLNASILRQADLSNADLDMANLIGANLNETSLSGANLYRTNFNGAILRDADFSNAYMQFTNLGEVDLSQVKGLDTVKHEGPSTIGIDTVYASHGDIPEAFLKGAGVDDTFITYIRSLTGKAIEYYSCFISYSSKDKPFATRLYESLQNNNVRCWYAPEDLKIGAVTREGIDEAIRLHDKLLLILSKHSVASGWVEHEVKTAIDREKKEKRVVLFPVRMDNAVFDCPYDWATEIRRERNIGDFTRWKQHDYYQKAFSRLLRDLKAETLMST